MSSDSNKIISNNIVGFTQYFDNINWMLYGINQTKTMSTINSLIKA